jgi:hypothetical protein
MRTGLARKGPGGPPPRPLSQLIPPTKETIRSRMARKGPGSPSPLRMIGSRIARKQPGGPPPKLLMCAKKKVALEKKKSTLSKTGLIAEGPPDEKLENGEEWPPGWTRRVYARKNGATKNRKDRYWYTPVENFKLRSMVDVKRFLAALKAANGEETTAKQAIKKKL